MKLEPGFITHWKTELLIDKVGPEGIVVILKLWSTAQIKRKWKGLEYTPKRLAMETKWKGDANHLFEVLTDPDAPWLDKDADGTFSIHDFEVHQRQVIHLWSAGGKGGRPKKEDPDSNIEDSSTSSYSSSSPIGFSNGNHMVLEPEGPSVPTRKVGDLQGVMKWVNSLKTEWGTPAQWSHAEMRVLAEGAGSQILELSEDQKSVIGKFLSADVNKADAFWQPRNRSKFVETFSDVCASAFRWAMKKGIKVETTETKTKGVMR